MVTYANRILPSCSDPRGLGEIEGQVGGVIQAINLIENTTLSLPDAELDR